MSISPVPEGQRLFPNLIVRGAAAAIAFYERAFGARVRVRLDMPDGRVGHAELELLGVVVYLADEFPDMGCVAPSASGTPVVLSVYVEDVDAAFARAVAAGATTDRPVRDEFYGDRVGNLVDPFGHRWGLHSRREELSEEELRRRMAG